MDFREAYQMPFKADPFQIYIWDNDHNMAFSFIASDTRKKAEVYTRVLSLLNHEPNIKPFSNISKSDAGITFASPAGLCKLIIRGWGHLTGSCGLKLNPELAINLQDQLAEYAASSLSGEYLKENS